MAATWKPRQRNYALEKSKLQCALQNADHHPLKTSHKFVQNKVASSKTKVASSQAIRLAFDPLSRSLDGSDPLSMITSSNDPLSVLAVGTEETSLKSGNVRNRSVSDLDSQFDDDFQHWSTIKSEILSHYTTSEKLSITTSFLSSGEQRVVVKQSTVSDQVKSRLEQLDDFEDGSVKEMLNLSQQEFVRRIDELNKALTEAWQQDQRVKALKIAIQCAKLLVDVSVIQFYPSKFVLITDILDSFGKLVFKRIWEKSTYTPSGTSKAVQLPENFTPDQVPESAKETCRNWFFKIASIRELIPRFYVEAAILKCYSFFKPSEMTEALCRLSVMIRGVGNPLVALYARCYLCRVGITIDSTRKDYIQNCFDDVLKTYSQIQSSHMMSVVNKQSVPLPVYLSLYTPSVNWILQCMANKATEKLIVDTLQQCTQQSENVLLLNGMMKTFKPQYVASKAATFVQMIRECEDSGLPKHVLYRSLGSRLSTVDPPEKDKLTILNEVWKYITKLKEPSDYIHCVEVWIDFVMKNFGKREMNTVLGDLIKHMTPDRAFEDFYASLLDILKKIMSYVHNYSLLFSLEKFLSFIDLFQKEPVKINAARILVESYNTYQLEKTSDPVIINTVMHACKTLHDSVNALSLDDERRAVSVLIRSFIHTVDFGTNFEQQLNFYVDARTNFTNLDSVIADLVQCVNNLAVATRKVVKGNHSKKTGAFVRACAAYCFITIPSLENVFVQLNLYLLSCQVALLNICISQAEALIKAAIAALLEAPATLQVEGRPKSSEPFVMNYICNLLSTLLVLPDNPDQGVLVVMKGLLNVIKGFKFESEDKRVAVYLNVLTSLSALSQDTYLYKVEKVDANDAMYGHDAKFLNEIYKICSTVIEEILGFLKTLTGDYEALKKQSTIALTVLEHMLLLSDMSDSAVEQLAKNLWSLSQKHGYSDAKQVAAVLQVMKIRSHHDNGISKLLARISLQEPIMV